MKKIDLVYLWVDGNDKEFVKLKNSYCYNQKLSEYPDNANDCRFRDNQELKYSLRSIAKNAPWINKIYIVTNGQIPLWLDISSPKIDIVTHEEIMPCDALPTFNSEAIESCIANIPGLSEYFLYANDDIFINKPISPNYFFDKNMNPIIRFKSQKWTEDDISKQLYFKNITNVLKLARSEYGLNLNVESTHNIDAYRKSYYKDCNEKFKKQFQEVLYQRFRGENQAQRLLVSMYMIAEKGCSYKIYKTSRQKNENLYISVADVNNLTDMLNKCRSALFCLNDNQFSSLDNVSSVKYNLNKLFPEKQIWEKILDIQIKPLSDFAKVIVFAPDNNYFKYFAVALKSVINNSTPDEVYDIIVFDSDITTRNKLLLSEMLPENFSVRYFNMRDYIEEYHNDIKFTLREYWSLSCYYKCFIPVVMKHYEKVLFLDADVCVNENLSSLFDMDFEGEKVIVVQDTVSSDLAVHKNRYRHMIDELGLNIPEAYFNSGMVFFNNTKIDADNYLAQLTNLLKEKNLLFPDQDILNIIFENSKKLISCKYNCQYGVTIFDKNYLGRQVGKYKEDFLEARRNPVIIHYTSSKKPWHSPGEYLAQVFWKYAKQTPFYEEILYHNVIRDCVTVKNLQNILLKRKIFFHYHANKFMETFTFGNTRKYFRTKRVKLKKRVFEIKNSPKLDRILT